ncbi:MAG: hypothetical protein Q8Q42_04125 [Nanoarchaeota archaeon]|nr:hypothetical protein [Nanoarchaeota archaeon]
MVWKKEGVLFGLAILLTIFFNLNIIEAGTMCADNQIILRLSSPTNAHGEVWNGAGGYTTEICYDRIFGAPAVNTDRTCQSLNTNKVVGLSASTNAHAEDPSLSNYPINVCYGDLSCTARTGSCVGNESLVVSLSANTNAHLSNSSSYPVSICCTAAAPPISCTLNSASWDVTETVEGQNVDLEVITTNCQGLAMSFDVKERDGFGGSDDNVATNPVNVNVALDGTAVTNWTAEWQAEGWPESDPPEYYFTATLVSTGENIQSSNELLVYQTIPELPEGIVICSDYGNQQACNDDLYQVADNSVPASVDCSDPNVDCSCSWNTGTMSCDASWTQQNSSGSDIGTCYYVESSTDTCEDDGYLTVDLIATWIWDSSCDSACQTQNQPLAASCQSSQEVFQCPAQIPLPFFTFYNLLAALVLIAIVYWAISMRKRKRRRKR